MARKRVIVGGPLFERQAETDEIQASEKPVFELNFDGIPEWLRVGPWSVVAKVYLLVIGGIILSTGYHASTKGWTRLQVLVNEMRSNENEMIDYARLIAGTYGFGLYIDMLFNEWKTEKFCFIKSYTIWSWLLLSTRLLIRGCSVFNPSLLLIGEMLRYPVIVQHITVFVIW